MPMSSPKQTVYDYYMSMHIGVCMGPLDGPKDGLVALSIGQILAWSGWARGGPVGWCVWDTTLFGGDQSEGGAQGNVIFLPGLSDQVLPNDLAYRMCGGNGTDMSGYRGVATVAMIGSLRFQDSAPSGSTADHIPLVYSVSNIPWLAGSSDTGTSKSDAAKMTGTVTSDSSQAYALNAKTKYRGFNWSTNNPYLKDLAFRVRRAPKVEGLDATLALLSTANEKLAVYFVWDMCDWMGDGMSSVQNPDEKTGRRVVIDASGTISNAFYDAFVGGSKIYSGTTTMQEGVTWNSSSFANGSHNGTFGYVSIGPIDFVCSGSTNFIEAAKNVRAFFKKTLTDATVDRRIVFWIMSGRADDYNNKGNALSFSGYDNSLYAAKAYLADMLSMQGEFQDAPVESYVYTIGRDSNYVAAALDNASGGSYRSIYTASDLINATTGMLYNNLDANPAYIIAECLTNTSWGMGSAVSALDLDSFKTASATLISENLGLSMAWTQSETIENFVQEILDHIQGVLFVNPFTGLLTLNLIRAEYDIDSLPTIDPSNANLSDFDRKAFGEITNQVTVTWTNPENEQEETVTAQDISSVANQGAIIPDSKNYYGVRTAALAMKLAQRDLRLVSAPLASLNAIVDRSGQKLLPGGCVKVNWPEYGLNGVVFRIGKVQYGKVGSGGVTAALTEDIYALTTATYTAPAKSAATQSDTEPRPLKNVNIMSMPYYMAQLYRTNAHLDAIDADEEYAAIFASCADPNTQSYEIDGMGVLPNGTSEQATLGTGTVLGCATLKNALKPEARTANVVVDTFTGSTYPTDGGLALITNPNLPFDPSTAELTMCNIGSDGTLTLDRGILDTIPRAWPTGCLIYFFAADEQISDYTPRASNQNVSLILLPQASGVSVTWSPARTALLAERQDLPLRPANVTINGQSFGVVDARSADSLVIAWANRNRLNEDGQIMRWTDGNMYPEAGQTTTIEVLSGDSVIKTYSGLTGTTETIVKSDLGTASIVTIRITSVRGGLTCYMPIEYTVVLSTAHGYGEIYGYDYGGTLT